MFAAKFGTALVLVTVGAVGCAGGTGVGRPDGGGVTGTDSGRDASRRSDTGLDDGGFPDAAQMRRDAGVFVLDSFEVTGEDPTSALLLTRFAAYLLSSRGIRRGIDPIVLLGRDPPDVCFTPVPVTKDSATLNFGDCRFLEGMVTVSRLREGVIMVELGADFTIATYGLTGRLLLSLAEEGYAVQTVDVDETAAPVVVTDPMAVAHDVVLSTTVAVDRGTSEMTMWGDGSTTAADTTAAVSVVVGDGVADAPPDYDQPLLWSMPVAETCTCPSAGTFGGVVTYTVNTVTISNTVGALEVPVATQFAVSFELTFVGCGMPATLSVVADDVMVTVPETDLEEACIAVGANPRSCEAAISGDTVVTIPSEQIVTGATTRLTTTATSCGGG